MPAPIPAYVLFASISLAIGLFLWLRLTRRDWRLSVIFASAIFGALFGARLVYLAAEGWLQPGPSSLPGGILPNGKSILGGLLGGYGAVELAKWAVRHRAPTGDRFAAVVPIGLALSRIGCLFHGCCLGIPLSGPGMLLLADRQGVARWPAVPVEMAFNLGCVALFWWLRRTGRLAGQHFHLYLIGYGSFRFLHEFLRATPKLAGPFSGYHLAALAVAGLGGAGFALRHRTQGRNRLVPVIPNPSSH